MCDVSFHLRIKTAIGSRAFRSAAPSVWNLIPIDILAAPSLESFLVKLKTHYLHFAFCKLRQNRASDKADLAFTYKIIFGLVNLKLSDFFTLRTNCKTRCHPYRLALTNNKNTLRRNFLIVRIIKPWNLLPASNDNFNSFTYFKRFLNNLAIFLNYVNIN